MTDGHVDIDEVPGLDAPGLVRRVREAMSGDPTDAAAHVVAIAEVERQLGRLLPDEEQGLVVNDLIEWLREHPEVDQVADLADAFGLGERTLQRLVLHRVGITPKWLIQRRRPPCWVWHVA